MSNPEFEAIAEVVEAWEPGVAVVGDAVATAQDVDGVLTVEVETVQQPSEIAL